MCIRDSALTELIAICKGAYEAGEPLKQRLEVLATQLQQRMQVYEKNLLGFRELKMQKLVKDGLALTRDDLLCELMGAVGKEGVAVNDLQKIFDRGLSSEGGAGAKLGYVNYELQDAVIEYEVLALDMELKVEPLPAVTEIKTAFLVCTLGQVLTRELDEGQTLLNLLNGYFNDALDPGDAALLPSPLYKLSREIKKDLPEIAN